MNTKLPEFKYRQFYQIEINTIEKVNKLLLTRHIENSFYFRGMSKYKYICTSTYYRYYLNQNPHLPWEHTDIGFGRKISLPVINQKAYVDLSFNILDKFEKELINLGITGLNLNSIIYLAQHYGLPTNLIDFTVDPKIALYFACEKAFEDDAVIYLFDIYSHIVKKAEYFASQKEFKFKNEDGSIMTKDEIFNYIIKRDTTITRNDSNNVTPSIKIEDLRFNKRIFNQKGVFIYNSSTIPFDSDIYRISTQRWFSNRRVFKINKNLKPLILKKLNDEFGINNSYIYPDHKDINIDKIKKAITQTLKIK